LRNCALLRALPSISPSFAICIRLRI
jgi:hypothetical protein